MNLRRRVMVCWVASWVIRVRFLWRALMAWLVFIPCHFVIAFARRRSHSRFEAWMKAADSWKTRANSFCAECKLISQAGDRPAEVSRLRLLATALFEEQTRLRATAAELRSPHPIWGSAALTYMLDSSVDGIFRTQRRWKALSRIFSQFAESHTFYWDVLLCLLIPSSHSEELPGDLAEEYQLRNATEGEDFARAWYRRQVITTLRDCLWERIERLAAIGTLVDLVGRWFRS